MNDNVTYDYDQAYDILYCSFKDQSNSYGDEDPDNVVIMRDIETDEITGVTILDFKRMIGKADTASLLKQISLKPTQGAIDKNKFLRRILDDIMVKDGSH